MGIETQIQLFDNAKIRVAWDDEKEKYFFSVVDVIGVLTESTDGRTYWKVLKNRLLKEGNETVTNCNQLKLPASDGKMRLTDVADLEGILRIVQSVPSKKAEQNMRRMRQFYEEWVEVFENRSSVMSEMGIIPLSADIQPEAPPRNQPLIFGLPMCVHILPIQEMETIDKLIDIKIDINCRFITPRPRANNIENFECN